METYEQPQDMVKGPAHYGGANNPYEVIKVCEAWGIDNDAYLFNAIKYIARAGKKDPKKEIEDLRKAIYYLERRVSKRLVTPQSEIPSNVEAQSKSSNLAPALSSATEGISRDGSESLPNVSTNLEIPIELLNVDLSNMVIPLKLTIDNQRVFLWVRQIQPPELSEVVVK